MSERWLVVSGDSPKPIMKLQVIDADMPHPGWVRFTMPANLAHIGEEPTICWYHVPADAHTIEVQSELVEDDFARYYAQTTPSRLRRVWAWLTRRPA